MKYMDRVVFSTDDLPMTIVYPRPMSNAELDDISDFLALWMKGLRRIAVDEQPPPAPPA